MKRSFKSRDEMERDLIIVFSVIRDQFGDQGLDMIEAAWLATELEPQTETEHEAEEERPQYLH